MAKTTAAGVAAFLPSQSRKEIPDGIERGLYIVVQASGSKSYAFRFTSPVTGKSAKLTLGRADDITLKQARIETSELRQLVRLGRDPAIDRKTKKERVADDPADLSRLIPAFLKSYAEDVRPSSLALARNQFAFNIIGKTDDFGDLMRDEHGKAIHDGPWRGKKVQDITFKDVTLVLSRIKERGANVEANRVHALLRRFFNWCVEKELIDRSPIAGKKRPTKVEPSRERVLSPAEIRLLWLATAERTPFNCVLRVLLLTGQRRLEVSEMPRKELDLANATWTIPAARTKNKRQHAVPLTPLVVETINASPVIGKKLVFTLNGEAPLNGWSKDKGRVAARMTEIANEEALRAGEAEPVLEHWTVHDLRRTAASGMAGLRQPVHVVEAVLNHRSGTISRVAAVYNRFAYDDEKREALQAWSNYVSAIVSPTDNVVSMHRAVPK